LIPKLSTPYLKSDLRLGRDEEKCSLWDINDYDKITAIIKRIQQGEKIILSDFENNLDRRWRDQRTGTVWRTGEKFEPVQVEINQNTVVNSGLILLSELISGEEYQVPLWLASGRGTEQVSEDQEVLSDENARVSVTQEGWRTSAGNSIKMGGRFDPNTPSDSIAEFGSFDEIVNGNMEWRVVLDGPPLVHTQGSTFYMCFHTLYLNSK
jgi:hypothetical protein